MLIGPKYKICKRLGASVFEKCQTQKFQLAEARAPRRSRPKRGGGADFGLQLLEKQKARFTYGLSESQFSRYVQEAMSMHGKNSSQEMLSRLESRLDNVIYRAGFAKTRRMARQLVSHGHVIVNGHRMTIPSHLVHTGDSVSVRTESRTSPLFLNRAEQMLETKVPGWMEVEDQGMAVKITGTPVLSESETPFNASTIIQFYSR